MVYAKSEPKSKSDIRREVIWFNKIVNVGHKHVFIKDLHNKGLVFIFLTNMEIHFLLYFKH